MAAESLEESPQGTEGSTPAEEAPEQDATEEKEAGEKSAPKQEDKATGWWPYLRERYFSMDRRLLGLFRIYFGFLLLIDVLRRIPEATFFYSNEGVLSNHFSLYAPMVKPYFSLFTAFSTPTEVKVAFFLTAFAHCFYIVGYRTKVAQVVSFVLYTSLNARNHFVENGGCVMVALVACWSMFLPLGDRFSIDAVLKSLRARRDLTAASLNDREGIRPNTSPHVTLVALCFLLQIAVCYFFNTVHKNGVTWKNGEAVHWVLWQNRIATHLAAWLRMHEPPGFSWLTTKGTLVIEGIAALLVLTPVGYRLTRPLNFLLTTILHLSIAALCTLGPFSYVMVALNGMALPSNVFDWLSQRIRKGLTRRTVVYDPTDAGLHHVARILARLDTYELLTFVDSADKDALPPQAPRATIATFDQETGRWTVGTAAVTSAFRSLPLGQLWGPLLDNSVGQSFLRALLRRRARLAASYYLEAGRRFDQDGSPHEPGYEMTPWREHVSSTLIVLRESMVSVVLLAAFFQVMHDNWWIPPKYRLEVPAALKPINLYPRLLQGWSMFSPDAPKTDGTLVVDGITVDGRHLDPLTGKEPDFEAPLHGPWFHSQLQCDYTLKISFEGNRGYREELKRYILNWQRIEKRPPNDRIVSFDLYWVSNDAPPPGSTKITNIQKKLLMSGR
ncbi:MAG: HTTM domain-containing protein [Myxococcales bacterium]|nr:HTTM domain-containing protein [Polyangiaceae bacterium]MDW8251818.1 HTTM domain-containing protein [Myxococcales bacterium]